MKLVISWKEGREVRTTQTEIPVDASWPTIQEWFRLHLKTAIKYSDVDIPEGLLKEGEAL